MADFDEREITFEEIGLSKENSKIDKIKKIVNINLKIKRMPKRKVAFKGDKNLSKAENKSNKPVTFTDLTGDELDQPEVLKDTQKSKLVPTLCNGTSCPTTDEIMTAIEELRDLVRQNCNETRQIRQELVGLKAATENDNPSYVPFIRGSCQTMEDLNLLEYRVLEDEISRKALETVLDKLSDSTLEKYVRACLKSIVSDKVAVKCVWHGKKDSPDLAIHDMAIIRVVCDCTRKKFPTASSSLICSIMKTWFKCSKERFRKSAEAKKLKLETKEAQTNLT